MNHIVITPFYIYVKTNAHMDKLNIVKQLICSLHTVNSEIFARLLFREFTISELLASS